MTIEEEINKNLSLIEYYKDQLNSLELQSQYLQAALTDYHKGKITIEQLEKIDDPSEILIPIGGGMFLNGSVINSSKVLVDIGAGLVTEKSIEDAIKKIDEHITTVQENQEKLFTLAQRLQNEATELSQKTQQLMQQSKK